MSAPPPNTRARAASTRRQDEDGEASPVCVDELVAAVVARLQQSGLLSPPASEGAGAAAAAAAAVTSAPPALGAGAAPPLAVKTEEGAGDLFVPPLGQQRLWLEDLRQQLQTSAHFGVREREEVRGLLVIGETSGPPREHQAWYWGRVRLFIIVAHQGWAAAVRDARTSDMERLGIQLLPEVARPPSPPRRGVAGPAGWRGRPSRPSGLRAPPRGASAAPAPKRKD